MAAAGPRIESGQARAPLGSPGRSAATRPGAASDWRARSRWWALGAVALALLVVGLDTTVVVIALPTLSTKLGASTDELQWVMNAYTLVLAGLIIPAGVLGDRFGRRRILMIGLFLFGVASAAASQMSSPEGLIALRAAMGVGAAAIVPLTFAILPSLFSAQERPRAVAVLAATVFLGLPLGPLVAGWLLTRYAWGSIFLINVPLVAAVLVGLRWLVPETRDVRRPRLDWPGALLSTAGVTALVYAVVEQPTKGWDSPTVLYGLILGVMLVAGFVVRELRTRSPLVDLGLFRSARFSWSTFAFVIVGFTMGGLLFVLTPFLQIVQGNDPQATGIRLLPMIAGIVVTAVMSDRLTARLGTKALVAGGLLVTAAGAVILSRAGADSGYGLVAAAEVVMGLGIGLAMPPAADAILGTLPAEEAGAGMALTRTLQFVAMSFGVAILGSILNGAYRSGLHLSGLPPAVRAAAAESIAGAQSLAPHALNAARNAYASGMSEVMLTTAGVLVVAAAFVGLLLPRREPLEMEGPRKSLERAAQPTVAAPPAKQEIEVS